MALTTLVGPRCSGKTSVGKELARRLARPFVDGDELFQERYGSISDFIKKYSWVEFRAKESDIITLTCLMYFGKQIIFAPGGGAVAHSQGVKYREQNVRELKNSGQIFYLLPSPNLESSARILAERQYSDPSSLASRPTLTQESDKFKEMLAILKERDSLYLVAAHKVIYTKSLGIPEIADKILGF